MNSEQITYEGMQQEVFIKELEEIIAKVKAGDGIFQSNRMSQLIQYRSHFMIGDPRYHSFLKNNGEKEFRVEFVARVF